MQKFTVTYKKPSWATSKITQPYTSMHMAEKFALSLRGCVHIEIREVLEVPVAPASEVKIAARKPAKKIVKKARRQDEKDAKELAAAIMAKGEEAKKDDVQTLAKSEEAAKKDDVQTLEKVRGTRKGKVAA